MRMRTVGIMAVCILAVVSMGVAPAKSEAVSDTQPSVEDSIGELTSPSYLFVLGTGKDFILLQQEAKNISKKVGVKYSMMGNIFDKKRGLLSPDSDSLEANWGYFHRRYDQDFTTGKTCISIEKSDGYPGMKKGYYIIVGGIEGTAKEAKQRVLQYKKVKSDAYVQKTEIYMGCCH